MDNLFIIGSPRSGTTFLASLLEPTRYGNPFETQFILKYNRKLHQYGDLSDIASLKKLVEDINNERAILQWGVELDADRIYKNLAGKCDYRGVVDQVCVQLTSKWNKQYWGDKTPHYLLHLAELVAIFPDAKYIYIVRDGRDVALSLLQKKWGPNNFYMCAREWTEANEQSDLIESLERNNQLIMMKYEQLIKDPVTECNRVYEFIGESPEKHESLIRKLTEKTLSSNSDKWKSGMSVRQQRAFESVAGNCLRELGYETRYTGDVKINTMMKLSYYLHDRFCYALHMFDQNVIDYIKIRFFNKEPFGE